MVADTNAGLIDGHPVLAGTLEAITDVGFSPVRALLHKGLIYENTLTGFRPYTKFMLREKGKESPISLIYSGIILPDSIKSDVIVHFKKNIDGDVDLTNPEEITQIYDESLARSYLAASAPHVQH